MTTENQQGSEMQSVVSSPPAPLQPLPTIASSPSPSPTAAESSVPVTETKDAAAAPPPHTVTIHNDSAPTTSATPAAATTTTAVAAIKPAPDPNQPVTDPSLWQYPWEEHDIDLATAEKRRAEQQEIDKKHPYVPHQGQYRQYMRDIILGVNDGLVSMFLLLIGLIGGGAKPRDILLAGITGAIAGAISMALGEYIATKSQSEVVTGDLNLEIEHFRYHRRQEMEQVYDELNKKLGLTGETLKAATRQIGTSNDAMLNFMKAFEFGFTEQDNRSPFTAMAMSGGLFITGSLPSVVPFFFVQSNRDGLICAAVLCGVALMLVGAIKTVATRTSPFHAAMENLLIGGVAAAISYGVGAIYTAVVGDAHSLNN